MLNILINVLIALAIVIVIAFGSLIIVAVYQEIKKVLRGDSYK